MKKIEINTDELARWICNEVLNDDCDNCPQSIKCSHGNNPIEKMLDEQLKEGRN